MWDAGTALLLDNRYQLDQQIASGEFSDIWRGTDVVLARPVAVKLLRAGVGAQTPEMARFRTAARHAGLLAHENIARVYDYDESGGAYSDGSQPPFMVMEFVDGPSLAAVLAGGPLEPARVMDLIAQSAAGLHAVHRAGLVHGDIRPETLLLGSGDVLKVTHFGLSHASQSAPDTVADLAYPDQMYRDQLYPDPQVTGAESEQPGFLDPTQLDTIQPDTGQLYPVQPDLGQLDPAQPDPAQLGLLSQGAASWDRTAPRSGPVGPACLTPERAAGGSGTPAADLYSLGMVAYQCLAGSPPLGTPAVGSAPASGGAAAHPDNFPQPQPQPEPQPLPETVPATVALLVSELLDPDPARRPRDAAEVARRAGQLRDELIPGSLLAPTGYAAPSAARTGRPPGREQADGLAAGPGPPPGHAGTRPAQYTGRWLGSRVLLGGTVVAATVIALLITGVIGPGSHGPALPSNASQVGGDKTTLVNVNAAALRGLPVGVVQAKLRRLGLVVLIRWRGGQLGPGLVLSVRPSGRVPAGSVVVVIAEVQSARTGASTAAPDGRGVAPSQSKPPAPGRSQPATSPSAAPSATAPTSPAPATSPPVTTSPGSSPSPTPTPTGTPSSTPPVSPPATSVPSSVPVKTSVPSSALARNSAPVSVPASQQRPAWAAPSAGE